ncbi:uncharacterized protein zgc:173742 isoform X2 [Heptranchias perlo]|uniref:uncharacterized protein zgc:173742 isoform X2 n=1 Tax=Heptranchias perlo TaxID=212740 RepID=UPI0035598E5E
MVGEIFGCGTRKTAMLSKHFQSLMYGLTAKVFEALYVQITLQQQLKELTISSLLASMDFPIEIPLSEMFGRRIGGTLKECQTVPDPMILDFHFDMTNNTSL